MESVKFIVFTKNVFFQGSESFQPLLCVTLIQLVRTEHNKPVIIISSSVSNVDNGRDGFVFLALWRQISIDLVLRCSDAVITCYDFPPYFSIVYALKQTVAKEHWNGRHQNWVLGQHSFLTLVPSLLKQGDCISEGFFQLNICNSWPWHEIVWLRPH